MLVLGLRAKKSQQVAVVEMEGTIGSRLRPDEYVKMFRSLEENDRIGAVVLDVDSPGGSAPGSNYLYLAVQSLVKKKPVVAFIRGVGASGAYMFSAPTSRIIAIPSAIIGSIGVISMHPLLYEAMDRIGLRMEVSKSDQFKDMGSMFRAPTDEEKAKEQDLVDDLYNQFLDIVAEGRHFDRDKARSVATGEVFTARKGLELGLVDELGDLRRAIDVAAELGGIEAKPVWLHPRKSLRETLSSMVAGAFINEISARIEDRIASKYNYQYRG